MNLPDSDMIDMLFSQEEEFQDAAQKIARLFWASCTINEVYDFIDSEFVPKQLVKDVLRYLKPFDSVYHIVILSYARLLLRDRYKLGG